MITLDNIDVPEAVWKAAVGAYFQSAHGEHYSMRAAIRAALHYNGAS